MDFLLALALLPAVVLGAFIYKKDKTEKEPKGLLIALLIAGVAICYPAGTVESIIFAILDTIMPGQSVVRIAIENFIGVALVEEGFKWLAMILITRKNKNFNSVFDGVIYAVFVSLGFAAFENILYVMDGGLEVALARAVLAVPGHVFDAIFMGYYYSWYHLEGVASQYEVKLKNIGGIEEYNDKYSNKKEFAFSLLVPVVAHGFYDFSLSVDSDLMFLIFLAFVAFMYFYCFRQVIKMSKGDMADTKMALVMICAKYPAILEIVSKIQLIKKQKAEAEGITADAVTFEEVCDYITLGEDAPVFAAATEVQPVAITAPYIPVLGRMNISASDSNNNDFAKY